MKVVISSSRTTADVGTLVMNHKVRLGNKYAFLINKEVIGKVKSNLFSIPPRRVIEGDLDKKLEEEASTSASSGESVDQIIGEDKVKCTISAGTEEQAATTKRLVGDLLNFEEFLCNAGLATVDSIREVRKFTRFLIANAIKRKEDFATLTRESISLAAILLAAERFELDMAKILNYIIQNCLNKRINKLSKIRECKAYSLLMTIVESYGSIPSSP